MTPTGHIDKTIKNIPNKTGVYQYYDKNQSLLYVGKAKNLKKRVSSYFTKNQENERIKILISKIQDIKYVLVETEMDALNANKSCVIAVHSPAACSRNSTRARI